MSAKNRNDLKLDWVNGATMTQQKFDDFIDSVWNLTDNGGPTAATDLADFNDLGATSPDFRAGRFYYANGSFNVYIDEPDVTLQVGEELWIKARNNSGSDILNGSIVYISGAQGDSPTVELASNTQPITSRVLGMATHTIEDNSFGYITTEGLVNDVNTVGLTAGTVIYLGATAGSFTSIAPNAPIPRVEIGTVVREQNAGKILIHVREAININDVKEILIINPQDKDRLAYDAQQQAWINSQPQDLVYRSTIGSTALSLISERIFSNQTAPVTYTGPTGPAINTVYEIIDAGGTASLHAIKFEPNGFLVNGATADYITTNYGLRKYIFNGTNYNKI